MPSYLRSKEYEEFCLPEGKLDFERMENGTASEECTRGRDGLWEAMCAEAAEVSRQELILSSDVQRVRDKGARKEATELRREAAKLTRALAAAEAYRVAEGVPERVTCIRTALRDCV